MTRVMEHPILGAQEKRREVTIFVDDRPISAYEGEPIAAVLLAHGIKTCRITPKRGEPRGVFCGIGQCTDCVMEVDGIPNVRTCVTPVQAGMRVRKQVGLGKWSLDYETT